MAAAGTLRIVNYNVDADTGSNGFNLSNASTVFQGIGNAVLPDNLPAQPIDVLAVEELQYSGANANSPPSATLANLTNQLNAIYGAGTYAYDTVNNISDGNSTGNGPSGLIYNTKTVTEIGVGQNIGTVGSSGAARAPMRYEFQPVGGGTNDQFYMYVSHAKSGTGTTNANRRNVEAQEIRTNSATLGTSAHIIYAGDFNLTSSTEAGYQTLIGSGVGQAKDPMNPANNWTATSSFQNLMSETATNLQFRDDLQLVTQPMLTDTTGVTLASEMVFANNGSVSPNGNITSTSAYPTLPNRSAVLSALTTTTDHLPMVGDYVFTVPEPSSLAILAIGASAAIVTLRRRRAS